MDQPGFGLPGRKYYLVERNDSNLEAYELLMRNIAVELGANVSSVDEDIKRVVDFEIQLANVSNSLPRQNNNNNECETRMTASVLKQDPNT